ncbi:MAG: nucleotidyltransferase domain-containing protein [Deltaproteobacteria bacterium]|nr:nucleotidyltransferase domain-containing protein [Deltaproteobacteria bacterium]
MKILDKNIEATEKVVVLRHIGYRIVSKEDNEAAVKQILDSIISYFRDNKTYTLNKVILFGSRSRDNYKWDSDFDFVVVTNEDISADEKYLIWNGILDKISEKRYKGESLDMELIVSGLKNWTKAINYVGHILRYANKEGKVLYG